MKPRKTPPAEGLVAVVWHDLLAILRSIAGFFDFVASVTEPLDQLDDLIRGNGNHVVMVPHRVRLTQMNPVADYLNINSLNTLLHNYGH